MARWRAFEDYSPFAQLLVEYMWEQRPPLLPNQFAQRMGVRKQQVSSWLNSDATPAPPVLMRIARGMGRPVSELFIAAGYSTPDDPLFDLEETWAHVLSEVQATPEFLALAEPQQIIVIGVLHAAHLRDRGRYTTTAFTVLPAEAEEASSLPSDLDDSNDLSRDATSPGSDDMDDVPEEVVAEQD